MRHTLILIILCALSVVARAQDKIYCRDGKVMDGKVARVGTKTIIYRKMHEEGVEYTIQRKDVTRIVYANGVVDDFEHNGDPAQKKVRSYYGKDIISLIPGAYTASIDNTINDPGVGICYERLLDDRLHIALTLPVYMSFSSSADYAGQYNSYVSSIGKASYTSICYMPGIKLYPGPGSDRFRYAIGLSVFAMFGKEPYAVYDNNATGNVPSSHSYSMVGMMISNSVSMMATKHLCLALNINGGIPFSDDRYTNNSDAYVGVPPAPIVQFSLQVGYRD